MMMKKKKKKWEKKRAANPTGGASSTHYICMWFGWFRGCCRDRHGRESVAPSCSSLEHSAHRKFLHNLADMCSTLLQAQCYTSENPLLSQAIHTCILSNIMR